MTQPMKNDQGAAQSTLPVIQADREATIDILLSASLIGKVWAEETRRGEHDDHPLVQAFARHRIEHSTPDRNAVLEEAAAWRDYTSASLSFDGGLISVNRDGSGYFCVNENEADWEADDESAATYIVAKFSAGEAQEIRDHLNKYFPPTTPKPTDPAGLREAALRAMQILQSMGDTEEGVTMAIQTLAEAVNG